MKILFFIESLSSGGKERRLVELIKGLKKYPDIECELVLTRKDIHYKDIFSTGVKIHFFLRKYLKKDPRLFFLFYKICKRYNPDIIHVWGNMVAIYVIPAKVLLKIPMINNQITNAQDNVNKGILSHKLTFNFSDLIISNSIAGLKTYSAPEKKSVVVYNGFDFSRLVNLENKENVRTRFKINTVKVVGMVANFTDKKDYNTYIIASKQIAKKRQNVTFLAVGNGVNFEHFKNKINNYDKIKLIGSQKRIESIINTFDICVLSTYTESCSNSIMEYMALGKPVIATDGGGTKELIIDGKTGYLVKVREPEELAEKIELLLDNKEMAINMGKAGKKRIEKEFSLNKMIKSYYKLFQKY